MKVYHYDENTNQPSNPVGSKCSRKKNLCFLYFLGGFDDNCSLETCERYSPKTEKWDSVAKLSCPRGGVGLAALGGRLYAVGGHDGRNYLSSVEAYDPLTDR